jgi:integrase/recombinase XerD
MRAQFHNDPSLFGPFASRKYLNTAERRRFLELAQGLPSSECLFCEVLAWTGARISEVLALTPAVIDMECGAASIETLKRRKRGIVRQVPLPTDVLNELERKFSLRDAQRDPDRANERMWKWSRTTAWRRIKEIMASAGISGMNAMPKGLRHGFGVNAFQANVPPHLVQRWLGQGFMATWSVPKSACSPNGCGK